jgi:quercetin dioxygenase-like cupin family protein
MTERTMIIDDLAAIAGSGGVVWSASPGGVHTNLVVLDPGGEIGTHRNDAVDVLVIVLDGAGVLTIDGSDAALTPIAAVLVPRGATRSVRAGADGVRYLTVHAEREPLTIGTKGSD